MSANPAYRTLEDAGVTATPQPRLAREWVGGVVRTRHEIRNAFFAIPKGTLMEVVSRSTIVRLLSLPCPCCGIRSQVSFSGGQIPRTLEWVGRHG